MQAISWKEALSQGKTTIGPSSTIAIDVENLIFVVVKTSNGFRINSELKARKAFQKLSNIPSHFTLALFGNVLGHWRKMYHGASFEQTNKVAKILL